MSCVANRYAPISFTYEDENLFDNTDGIISLKSYEDTIILYSNFDVDTNANMAYANTTSTETGTPVITAGGVFGNYVDITNASIKYDKSNFNNSYIENTIKTKIRLDFDNGRSYQDFLRTTITAAELLASQQNPNDIIFYSSFNSSINANWGEGTLTGTVYLSATFGPGGKFGNQLLLNQTDARYITYSSIDNTPTNTGCFEMWLKPNYSGSPIANQTIFKIHDGSTNANRIELTHTSGGILNLIMYNKNAVSIMSKDFGTFTPVTNTLYHISVNFDITSGTTRLFVDGIQLGTVTTGTGERNTAHTLLQIGSNTLNNNFGLDEFLVYDATQHTTTFTPSNIETQQTELLDTTYEFKLKINGAYINGGADINVLIEEADSWALIASEINNNITGANASVNSTTGRIRITADAIGHDVKIEAPTDGYNLVTLLSGIDDMVIPNGPSNNTNIIQFYNSSTNVNRLILEHSTIGELTLKMYDSSAVLQINENLGIWSSVSNTFYEFTLCFNGNIAQLYIDGIQFGNSITTGFERTNNIDFFLTGHATDGYGFDELVIYNTYRYVENYSISATSEIEYPTSKPYVIINYGTGIDELESITYATTGTGSITIIPYIGTDAYYFIGGEWVASTGTYAQSNSIATFDTNFSTFTFDENESFKMKAFFSSNGTQAIALSYFYLMVPSVTPDDYSPIITWVRSKLGEPVLPVELADSQIESNIEEALERWLYYRNTKEDFVIMNLTGNAENGYNIPDGWENFHDIIFEPRSPVSGLVYSGDWGKNIYMQYFYSLVAGGGGFMSGLLTDFYLTMSAMSDASIILGFQPTYSVFDDKIYIHPKPMADVKVSLIRKKTPSVAQLNADMWIRRYVLALSKITLGELREIIGSIPAGMENVPLNGSQLKAEGHAESEKLENEYRLRMEPLFLQFF